MSSASSNGAVAAVNIPGPIDADASSEYASTGSHSDSEDAQLQPTGVKRGPYKVAVVIDADDFRSACARTGEERLSLQGLMQLFECSKSRVCRMKKQLGICGGGPPPDAQDQEGLPGRVWLSKRWGSWVKNDNLALYAMPVATAREVLAAELGVSTAVLNKHMAKVSFDCVNPWTLEEVCKCMREIQLQGWCRRVGATFACTQLRIKYGMFVREHFVRQALRLTAPLFVRDRATKVKKKKSSYDVKGPRSLYHADAHEKLAKIWGFWIHGCLDGFSRWIVYLKVDKTKLAEVVRKIYVEACNEHGWPSRTRWDRGKENILAILAQIEYHWDPENPATLKRGSAITVGHVKSLS